MNFFYRLVWYVGRVILWLYRVEVSGLENVPKHGAMLCPNHADALDPVLILLALPKDYRLYSMAKASLLRIPILGPFLRAFGAFPVERGKGDLSAIKTSLQTIKDGNNLMIFPEGTRIVNGVGRHDGLPAHAHAGIATIGVRAGAVWIPVFVGGKKKIFHRNRVIFGAPYHSDLDRNSSHEELQALATDILREAYALGGQKIGGEPL